MAELIIQSRKIKENIKSLSDFFFKHNIHWSLITKVFSGDLEFLNNVLTEDVIEKINSVGDSRLTSLKNLKSVNPSMRTIYIKPPAEAYADELVEYADISLNSSFTTLKAINEAAARANKTHQVIIMVELGELREGVNREDIMDFYEKLFELKNIDVIGIGSNLGCMYGIEPTHDKLMQLSLYKELIAERYNHDLPLISGGTSITLPLVKSGDVPKEVNHFRIGEAAFFGISPLDNKQFDGLYTETFEFEANIIEIEQKKLVPEGTISDANIGHTAIFDDKSEDDTSVKAILDFGLLDVDKEDLKASDPNMEFVGITSDMIVVDIGENKNEDGSKKYHIGDRVKFIPNYMAVARLLNSKFVEKRFVE